MDLTVLPGYELIGKGLDDLAAGRETAEALLVAIGARRLQRAGVEVPSVTENNPEHRLYELLSKAGSDSAHSRYNALIRQLVSFERAAECGPHVRRRRPPSEDSPGCEAGGRMPA